MDGNDILALVHVVAEAAARARAGEGPTLIEALTYRRGAHTSSDDPSVYRDPAEPKEWEPSDPLRRFRAYLEAKALWSEADEAAYKLDVEARFAAAVKAAEAAVPKPPVSSLFDDVYAVRPWHLEEQAKDLEARIKKHGDVPARH